MLDYAKNSEAEYFIIGTEEGMIEMLKQELPEKKFCKAQDGMICHDMKEITLEKVLEALETENYSIKVPEEIRIKAKKALDKMLEVRK